MNKMDKILQGYAQGKQDKFKFFGFISPPETEEQYRWAKECGYTDLGFFYAPEWEYKVEKALELAKKNDLKIIWMGEDFVKADRSYADHEAFDGVYVDEPLSIGDLEKLCNELDAFQEKYPTKNFYVNFARMEGRSWDLYSGYFRDHFLTKVKGRKLVCGDIYPLREPDKNGRTMMRFLEYMRAIGELAVVSDSKMSFFVQTIAMHGRGWAHPARRPSTEDIRFLHYVILSCGATEFSHFCYMSPGGPPYSGEFKEEDYSCIHPEGYRTEIWYSVQEVIEEFKKFENIALKFHWKGIMPVYGTQATERSDNFDELQSYVSSHSYIKSIAAQQDLLVGCFEDDDGNVGLTLVNFSDPYKKLENPVTITLNCAEPIAVIKNGEVRTVALENGVYNVVLQPGEGQYLILPKEEKAELQMFHKEKPVFEYLTAPETHYWKEDFAIGNQVDTYNVYGCGNSHFEFWQEGYPEGGSGRVVRLYSSTKKEKSWATFKFHLPNISYDENKKLVFKMFFTQSAFTASVSCDHMVKEYPSISANTLERYGEWTWLSVPMKALWHEGLDTLKEVTMCIGNGVPYGTVAYLDEILLCDAGDNEQEGTV